ncbi:MAG TPA: gluconate 2-dehydrogenase subunit 3 family protein, partial [Puia sp.]
SKNPDIPYLLTKKQLLAELSETIIPATATPGAREAGVVDFMLPILTECTETRKLNNFIEGLQDLEAHTRYRYQKDFTQCSGKEKEEILLYFEKKAEPLTRFTGKVKNKFLGGSFFNTLKQYSVECYCISEKGATGGLTYVPVPGRYEACIPLEPMQRAWATK